jgi:hypothetical protein
MDFGVVALIALNNMLFVFLTWVLLRSAAVLTVALGLSSAFLLLRLPSLWLSLEAGGYVAAFFKRRWFVLLIIAGAVVEVWPWLR